jgi:hypothetical protein
MPPMKTVPLSRSAMVALPLIRGNGSVSGPTKRMKVIVPVAEAGVTVAVNVSGESMIEGFGLNETVTVALPAAHVTGANPRAHSPANSIGRESNKLRYHAGRYLD